MPSPPDPPRSARSRPVVAVVGGGPTGLMAAEALAQGGARVTVYDRMPSLGRKLLMAGRGGLNLTHGEPFARFVARYRDAAPALRPALEAFPPEALRAWCHALGQPTFVGSSGRVFPVALKASPLLRAWLARLDGLGVALATRHRWVGFGDGRALRFETPGGPLAARPDAAILALGGASWPRLGSDGAWTGLLGADGIDVRPLAPANCGFGIAWSGHFLARHEGEPLKRVALAFAGTAVRGEATVTRHGIEGGPVYALSGPLRDALAAQGEATLMLDLRPDLSHAALADTLARPRGKSSTATFLRKAASLPPVAIGLLHEAHGLALPREPGRIAALVKAVPLRITGTTGLDRAISSAGGVILGELDAGFMLRRRPGLFAAGEMLDWEAPTGGYLLQATLATGLAAARGCLAWLADPARALSPGAPGGMPPTPVDPAPSPH